MHVPCTLTNEVSYQLVFLIGLLPVMCTRLSVLVMDENVDSNFLKSSSNFFFCYKNYCFLVNIQ